MGIEPTATLEQIKAAYRRHALKHHPDKNPDSTTAAERFKACNDAYVVLSDPDKRAKYTRSRREPGVQELVGSLVDDFLGGKRRRKRNGRDVRYEVQVSFSEAARGVSRRVQFQVVEQCGACAGRGAAPGGTRSCEACHGSGELKPRQGLLSLPQPCPHCGGQGIRIKAACPKCSGVGTVEKERSLVVSLPAGVRHGDVKILSGQGEPGRHGGRPGDLHVRVTVARDPLFRREGSDVLLTMPIPFCTAVVGGTVDVPTVDGQVTMKVPPGTQSGRVFRLRAKGFPRGNGKGDQLVTLQVETPVGLGSEEIRLLERFQVACGEASHPRRREFLDRVASRKKTLKNDKLPVHAPRRTQ